MDNLSNLTTAFQNTTSIQAGILSETKLVLYSVLLVFSLLGNILVIAVVFYNENLRSDFNYLIVNMAISDLFIPLLAIPQRISEVSGLLRHNEWLIGGVGGAFLCKLSYFLSDIAPAVSIFSLVIIAASRFVAIVYPFNVGLANALNKKNRILIALTWLTATALFGSYFYFVHLIPDQRGYWQCKLSFDSPKYFVIFYSFIIIGTYFVPFTIIAILYSIMVFKLYKRTRDIEEHFDDRQVRSRQRRNKKIFFLSIVIVLACFLFLGPIFCFLFVVNFIWKWDIRSHITFEKAVLIFFILQYLGYLYTGINPWIYFAFIKSYRVGLKRLLRCEKHSARRLSDSSRRTRSFRLGTLNTDHELQ